MKGDVVMKIDMHCHTKEGSIDGKVPIEEYIRMLRSQGFGGMLDVYKRQEHNPLSSRRKGD